MRAGPKPPSVTSWYSFIKTVTFDCADALVTAASGRGTRLGHHAPCFRIVDGIFWWTTRTPDGPATPSLRRDGSEVEATAWGARREWILARDSLIQ